MVIFWANLGKKYYLCVACNRQFMKRFLGLVAEDLLARVQDFENLTLVFPNKRAALFMAEELKSCTDKVM